MKQIMNKYLFFAVALFLGSSEAEAQYAQKSKGAGDLIESTSYNDHKRGTARKLNYLPDGEDFVCRNGENRYTRALYGSPTAWRLETSDRPIFATYVKRECRNIRFVLTLPDGTRTPLESTTFCEARYTPGRRTYLLTDKAWPAGAQVEMAVWVSPEAEEALWKVESKGLPEGAELTALLSDIRSQKLSRSGDMGADPPGCFDPIESGAVLEQLPVALKESAASFIGLADNKLTSFADAPERSIRWEAARAHLAGRIRISTPDPYLNTLGGALAVAADGVWGTEEVWLHGAVGWRMPLSGWRAGYIGDALGWHDRARKHFDNYAASQVTEVPCTIPHPAQDSALALARSAKQWGTPQYSNGYICRNPQRNNQMHHYDMNLCYIDELLWHLQWTGDIAYARTVWPVIQRHLAWEKLNYDPDNDGLYDAYACIWASDALYYNSGAVTHSSAYNYRANRLAACIAEKIGENPEPYRQEAERILQGLNSRLWMNDRGVWAEFQDFMGGKRLHTHPAVWTIYHAIDSDVANPFQAYLATRYVDREIPHIPVRVAEGSLRAADVNEGHYATISTTNWLPYSWSINNVAFAEVMHTALAYFEAGRGDEGFRLLKSSVLDGMYLGESPGNFGQISFYDAARGECYRDFGDPIGVASRLLVQGLYGVWPDALNQRLQLRPAFPADWREASLHTPDVDFSYQEEGEASVYRFAHRLSAVRQVELQVPGRRSRIASLSVNGQPARWSLVTPSVGTPRISVAYDAPADAPIEIRIVWGGETLRHEVTAQSARRQEGNTTFALLHQDDMQWWEEVAVVEEQPVLRMEEPFQHVNVSRLEPVKMDAQFNANVTDIFQNRYLSPRSPYTTLQIPVQGIGEWCHPLTTASIDDSGVRQAARQNGLLQTQPEIAFRTPAEGPNVAFTSLWDNYPDSLSLSLSGKASRAYLLMAGSTNHMQCHIDNGYVRVYYKDGTCDTMPLVNPTNWAPIEQFFFEDGQAFDRQAPALWRVCLKSGESSNDFGRSLGYTGINRMIDGGAAVMLEMPLQAHKRLSHLTVTTLSNEVVIGLMAVTLQR